MMTYSIPGVGWIYDENNYLRSDSRKRVYFLGVWPPCILTDTILSIMQRLAAILNSPTSRIGIGDCKFPPYAWSGQMVTWASTEFVSVSQLTAMSASARM